MLITLMTRNKAIQADGLSDLSVARLIGVHKRTLLRWIQDGLIPTPEGRLAKNRRAWTLREVEAIRQQLQRRDIDSPNNLEPKRRSGQDHHRYYPRTILRRQRDEGAAA